MDGKKVTAKKPPTGRATAQKATAAENGNVR